MERGLDFSGVYIFFSNIYVLVNKWEGVVKVREVMEVKEVRKVLGCSLIEVDGVVLEFGVGERFYLLMEEIMWLLF